MSNKNYIQYDEFDFDEELAYDSEGYPIPYDLDDFGTYDFENDFVGKKKCKSRFCSKPQDHNFVKKNLFYSINRECVLCGYSPELDHSKDEFEECHKAFINWEKTKK